MHSGIGRFAQCNRQRKGSRSRPLSSASLLLTSDPLTPEVLRQSALTPPLCFAPKLGCPQEFFQLLGHGWHSFTSRRCCVNTDARANVILVTVLKHRLALIQFWRVSPRKFFVQYIFDCQLNASPCIDTLSPVQRQNGLKAFEEHVGKPVEMLYEATKPVIYLCLAQD
jgi:hypothetical protein